MLTHQQQQALAADAQLGVVLERLVTWSKLGLARYVQAQRVQH